MIKKLDKKYNKIKRVKMNPNNNLVNSSSSSNNSKRLNKIIKTYFNYGIIKIYSLNVNFFKKTV